MKAPTDARPAPTATASASVAASDTSVTTTAPVNPLAQIVITNLGPGRFEISNTGTVAVRLKTQGSLERKDTGGAFQAIPQERLDVGKGYRLVEQCTETSDCIDLASGATLDPVRWSGFNCSAQCNGTCRANSFEAAGAYRLVVTTCDGSASIAGPEFALPDADHAGAMSFLRWGVATEVDTATVVRLEVPTQPGFDAASPASPDHVAGFVTRAGTERPLDQATRDELLALLRASRGFDDQVVKRCSVRILVGVRLVRTPSTSGPKRVELAEIALDFACLNIITAQGDARHRVVSASHFDPSRPAFVQWAKRALPADPDIAKLK